MKTILLGGLDPSYRDKVCGVFESQAEEFKICVLSSVQSLEEYLAKGEGVLLILDLDLKKSAGLEWLALISKLRSSVPVVAIGSSVSPDVRGYDKQYPDRYFPFVRYLKKPVALEALFDVVQSELLQATWGVIQGLSIPGLLQMLNMEHKTCTIRVTSGRRMGFFYLREGQIINARYRRKEGLDALQLLVYAPAPKMEIDSRLHDGKQLIDMRLEELLMQAAQHRDEEEQNAQEAMGGVCEDTDITPESEVGKWDRMATGPMPLNGPEGNQPIRIQHDLAAAPAERSSRQTGLWIGIVIAIFFGALGLFLIPRTVEVEIQTTPSGADVKLDGASRGLSPMRLKLSSPVKGNLEIFKSGHEPYQHMLSSQDRSLFISLKEIPAKEPEPEKEKEEAPPLQPTVNKDYRHAKPRERNKRQPDKYQNSAEEEKKQPQTGQNPTEKDKKQPEADQRATGKKKSDIFDQLRKEEN